MNDPGQLCADCGLCCDGTLFTHAPLRAAEIEPIRTLGLPVFTRADGVPAIPQPCRALEGPRCRIYADRPTACRLFECGLLHAFREDEVSLADARALIARTRAMDVGDELREAHLDRHFRGRVKRPR